MCNTHTMWVCFVRCAFLFKISWAGWNWQVWRYQENYMFMLYHDLRKEYLDLSPNPSLFSCRCVEKQKTWIMAKYEPNGHPIRYGYHALLPSFSKTPVYSISFWWAKLGNLWIKHINGDSQKPSSLTFPTTPWRVLKGVMFPAGYWRSEELLLQYDLIYIMERCCIL